MLVGCLHGRDVSAAEAQTNIGWDELNETLHWAPLEPSRNSLNWGLQADTPRDVSRKER